MPLAVVESGDGSSSTWLGTTRSLGREGVDVVRLSPRNWYQSKYCTTILCPDGRVEAQKFLTFLIQIGKKLGQKSGSTNVLFPSSDDGLTLISQNIESLKPYYEPVCPSWKIIQYIVNKQKTYQCAENINISIPETYIPQDIADVARIAKEVTYPCLLKPYFSHHFWPKFQMKLLRVGSVNELLEQYYRYFQDIPVLIQEEIPGPDHFIYNLRTSFNKDSEPLAVFTGRKLRQCPPHFGVGSFVESVWEPTIVELGIKILKKIRFYGIASVEFKKDNRTDDFKLLEINGRSGTQNYLATICGINTPYLSYKEAIGDRPKPLQQYSCQYELGVRWIHLSLDLMSMMKKYSGGELTITQWLHTILQRKRVYAFLSLDDPRPFLSEIKKYLLIYLSSPLPSTVKTFIRSSLKNSET